LALRAGHPRRATSAKRQLLRPLSASDRRMLAPVEPEQIAALFDRATEHGPHGVVDDYRAFGAPDWGFTLDQVTAPVRVWQGEDDTAIPPAIGRRLAAALPQGSLQIVPEAGHFLFLEHGQAVFEALRADLGA
jgi:pimeloyl-ACP methyl ester carboxylesterase